MTKEEVYAVLTDKGYEFESVDHVPVFTMEEMEREIHRDLSDVAKNVFLRDEKKKHWYLVVVQKDKNLDMAKLKDKIGSTRLSFAREDYLMERLGVERGAVTPLAILNDPDHMVEVILDEDMARRERIAIHPCDNTATVWMKVRDLETLIRENGNSLKKISL
ncbi:Prolyl-tRNA editing protein ProX [anaerobic digester metagenome]